MAKKAKKSAPAPKGKKSGEKAGSNDHAYTRLRTVLDSLEIGAIRYFASAPTAEEKQKRMEEIQDALKPIIDWLWEGPEIIGQSTAIDCPEGYTDCHGVCVPYPCPDL
jgi:hypothetical protein